MWRRSLSSKVFSASSYPTLQEMTLCHSQVHVVQCPPPVVVGTGDFFADHECLREELDSLPTSVSAEKKSVFIGGRVAIRRAMQQTPASSLWKTFPIIKNAVGAPILPPTWIGSISHKDNIAIAATRHFPPPNHTMMMGHLGVDIEHKSHRIANKFSKKLLLPSEQETLGKINPLSVVEDAMLRFSFKESIYKALNPFIPRYIGFLEAEVFPKADGTADISLHLKDNPSYQPSHYEAEWRLFQDKYVITCVYICK